LDKCNTNNAESAAKSAGRVLGNGAKFWRES